MKVIEPTPSQAVVVLKKYFQSLGFPVTASQVQEGFARSKGYADWQAFVSDNDPRGRRQQRDATAERQPAAAPIVQTCVKCGTSLNTAGFCEDSTCPYHNWPQAVALDDMCQMSRAQLEEKYGVAKREAEGDRELLEKQRWMLGDWLDEINETFDRMGRTQEALDTVREALCNTLEAGNLLDGFRHQWGRGEAAFEGGKQDSPFIQVSFDRELSPRFTIELILTLRDGKFAVYLNTWEFPDNVRNNNYRLFEELDDTVEGDGDETMLRLIERSKQEARSLYDTLSNSVTVSWD
ncbi:hypothetical protein [Burkholderia cenocepacia]|uniref:hypothetical protein n=1 Tax=Burkholderia cenocepacia TaxID=95486 RepID=UPI00076184A5|nr:hypothetical protein [Burkholderia cenocepacia]KWU23421.1 hypothetical protein AS149_37160 [Burkholderia cenocepacia]